MTETSVGTGFDHWFKSAGSAWTPFRFHHPLKRILWGGDEEDTFPVQYKMNTRRALQRLTANVGLREQAFAYLDDLSVFGSFRLLNGCETVAWRAFHSLGLTYPENCLLGVYQKPVDLQLTAAG